MEFGCFYNPRPSPGRCIKDNRSKVVEKECEIVNNACKLKSLPPLQSKKEIPKEIGKDKLSGPISAFVTKYGNKSYNFFGDAHFGMFGTCSPCQDINIPDLKISSPEGSENCMDISVLLSKVFNEASEKGVWIDFYLEIPFLSTKGFIPSVKNIFGDVKRAGYIYKLYYIFYNCLNKLNCKYDTTRFHYVDVRTEFKKVDLKEITSDLLAMIEEDIPEFEVSLNNYEMYINLTRISKSLNKLAEMTIRGIKEKNPYIEETDKLMRDLYFSGGQTMEGKIDPKNIRLFNLYLTSDNFADDVNDLMRDSLLSVKNSDEVIKMLNILVPPTMLVNRRGKNMHRARAQFEALENDGLGGIAQLIKDFILKKYVEKSNVNKIIDLWRGIMITYEGTVKSKYKSFEDVNMLIDKFKKEMKKLEELNSFSINSNSLLMDAYTLSRMFRKFSNKKHIDSTKSIVYAGDAHIQTYVEFFEKVLKTNFIKYDPNRLKIEKNDYYNLSRCLDVNLKEFL